MKGQPDYCCLGTVSVLLLTSSLCFGRSADADRIGLHATKVDPTEARGKPPNEYARLLGKLRAQQALVKSTKERVRQPFFSVSGRIMKINNEAIQVFEYSKAATTQTQAKRVSPDGKTIGNSKPAWMSTPHFFKSDKLIVLYVGDDQGLNLVLL